jgi:acyl carrier protein
VRGAAEVEPRRTREMADVEKRVKDVVARTLDVDAARITDDAHFVKDLGATSIQSVELVAAFEDEFDIEMEEEDALGVKTVGGAVEFIRKIVEGA